MKTKNLNSGLNRIEEIKNKISSYKNRKLCKVEVYESWSNIFEETEQSD